MIIDIEEEEEEEENKRSRARELNFGIVNRLYRFGGGICV
jgi:hypothetical protein